MLQRHRRNSPKLATGSGEVNGFRPKLAPVGASLEEERKIGASASQVSSPLTCRVVFVVKRFRHSLKWPKMAIPVLKGKHDLDIFLKAEKSIHDTPWIPDCFGQR